ncbi:TadE family protein [Ornithinimicrobium sp. W1665]
MGILEFGRLWAIQGSLAQASRDAARTAAITDSASAGESKFTEVFWALAPSLSDTLSGSTPVRNGTVGDEACRWTVTATYTTRSMTGFWPGDIPIRAQGAMRCNG